MTARHRNAAGWGTGGASANVQLATADTPEGNAPTRWEQLPYRDTPAIHERLTLCPVCGGRWAYLVTALDVHTLQPAIHGARPGEPCDRADCCAVGIPEIDDSTVSRFVEIMPEGSA